MKRAGAQSAHCGTAKVSLDKATKGTTDGATVQEVTGDKRKKRKGIETARSTTISVVALTGAYLVAGRLALELLALCGFLRLPNHILISLAALASLGFVACSQLLLRWAPTAALGQILVNSIINTRPNWETDTLRSFCEVGIWLSVIWSTFQASEGGISGCMAALLCGTIAGVFLVYVGEVVQAPLRKLETILRENPVDEGEQDETNLSLESGSMMLLALFGFSAISTIYENVTDVVVACGLASLGGLGILTVAKVIQMWEPTRSIGMVLQTRLLSPVENWRSCPARSAMESTFFAAVVLGMYTLHGDTLFALQVGTLSGTAVILSGELFEHGVMPHCGIRARHRQACAKEQQALVPPIFLAYGSFVLAVGFYAMRERQMREAAISTIANSICWVATASICARCQSLSHAGTVINDRILHAASNWVQFPLRSLLETAVWITAQLASYAVTNSVLASVFCGTATGLLIVLTFEAIGWGHLPWRQAVASAAPALEKKKVLTVDKDRGLPSFTWAEVAAHSSQGDAWLVIDKCVYDVTDWAIKHPGGPIINKFFGVDASDQFAAFHRPKVYPRLKRFLVGYLVDSEPSVFDARGPTSDYRALRERLWREGYFKPRPEYFAGKVALSAAFMVLAVAVVFLLPSRWVLLRMFGGSIALGFSMQQAAFVAHDAAHNGVVDPPGDWSFNWLAWFMCTNIFGASVGLWNEEHSMHHAITLRPCEDPQFNYLPLWLISMKELDVKPLDWATRILVPFQKYTFLPFVLVLARYNFYIISTVWALKRLLTAPSPRQAFVGLMDILGMVIFWLWFLLFVWQFESLVAKLAFVIVSQTFVGCLHMQLLLSHLCCETFTAEEERLEQFFTFQVKTTRNINAHWYDHWIHGGLEYQIEHHLFPQLPRHNLQKVQPFVQEICRKHGIEYESANFFSAVFEVVGDIAQLGNDLLTLKMG